MATMKEIAQLAGVSRGTVDRVLNKRGSVSPDTESNIREIAKELNYTPNVAGKNLAVRKKKLKFGYVLFGSDSSVSFFNDVIYGIEERASELTDFGVTVKIRQSPADDPEHQLKCIEELLEQGISGLAITPINHPLVIDRLKTLTKTGFPVVTANNDIPDCGRLAYVGCNYYKSGEIAAGLMRLITNGDINVGIISGSPIVTCHAERVAGFTEYSKKQFKNFFVVSEAANNDVYERSLAATNDMLTKYPQINALYITGAGVKGACRAVCDRGLDKKIKIICYDATSPTSQLLKDGIVTATITQQPLKQGAMPLDILLDFLSMGQKPESELNFTEIEIKIRESL